MKPTCREKECMHWSEGRCPFSLETWWQPAPEPGKKTDPVLLRDCAPIRTLMLVQELYNQQVRLQAAHEAQRNKAEELMKLYTNLITALGKKYNTMIEERKDGTLIED